MIQQASQLLYKQEKQTLHVNNRHKSWMGMEVHERDGEEILGARWIDI